MDLKWYSTLGYFYLGESCANAGQREKALDHLRIAEKMFKEIGIRYYLGKTYIIHADLYKRKGDQLKAKENLSKAIEILKQCGADGWVDKYEKELAEL